MTDTHEIAEQVKLLQERTKWVVDLLWDSPTSFHKRLQTVEGVAGDAARDILTINRKIDEIRKFVGMNGYGEKSMYNELKDAVHSITDLSDTIANIKGGIISTKDFQELLHKVDTLEKRDTAHITLRSYFVIAAISTSVSYVVQMILSRLAP